MELEILKKRLEKYELHSKEEELNAIKEIMQEVALSSLFRTDFFEKAAFQGGTALRIFYGLPRFSEDLDFILKERNPHFVWQPFLNAMQLEFDNYGLHLETQDRSKVDNAVQKAFIKEDSFGTVLTLLYPRNVSDMQKIQIKLEIDTHPPLGSDFDVQYLDFPFPYKVTLQDKPSLFAGKCHALLCRDYVKGRDWFDFVWYVSQKVSLNYNFLKNALYQTGPWKEQSLLIDKEWILNTLKQKINVLDWDRAKYDVANFLRPRDVQSVQHWNKDFFMHYVQKFAEY